MKSKWIEHNGKKILYQDFSNLFFNTQAVAEELSQVQQVVIGEPENSVLVLSDFRNTEVTNALMPLLNEASRNTKSHVRKTATLGITGVKRTLGDLLSRITGQPIMYFENEKDAKEWLGYYNKTGFIVLTARYHLSRGHCCGNGCKHCPYEYKNVPEPKRTELLSLTNGNEENSPAKKNG